MPDFAVVSSKNLNGRWDARYHIISDRLKERVSALSASISEDEARRRLSLFTLAERKPLRLLVRGERSSWNEQTAARVVQEYPHLSLAVMELEMAAIAQKIQGTIAHDEDRLAQILAVSPSLDEDDEPAAPSP